MSESVLAALVFFAALGSGLVAGLFFAFSVVVMRALRALPPPHGIAAMQSINVVVLNPWFFSAFFGTGAISVVLAVLALLRWNAPGARYLLAGGLLYFLGTILVTIAYNVPLNNRLAATGAHDPAAGDVWMRYLSTWTAWNHVRTGASLAASACFMAAL